MLRDLWFLIGTQRVSLASFGEHYGVSGSSAAVFLAFPIDGQRAVSVLLSAGYFGQVQIQHMRQVFSCYGLPDSFLFTKLYIFFLIIAFI